MRVEQPIYRLKQVGLAVVISALLAGCASTPQYNPQLDAAREALRSASVDPRTALRGAAELRSAERSLQTGEQQLAAGADRAVVEHHAYLARQQVAIALELGRQAVAEESVAEAHRLRSQMVLMARTEEADRARQEADRARHESEHARQEAERRAREAEEALARTRALEAQLAELEAKQSDRGMVLTLGDVLFDTGQAELKPGAMRTVDQLAEFMKNYPDRTVMIEGHTDNVGGAEMNQRLSERRAEAVRQALVARGISSQRIQVRGFGFNYPLASNATAEGRQQNRRVEVIISDESGRIRER